MADTKISGLAALGAAPAVGDLLVMVDISDTSMAPTGTDKKMTTANLFTAPTFTAPVLGAATATTINKVTITQPAASATLTIATTKALTVNKTLTLDGTDSTTMTFPSTSATIARTDAANTFTGHQTVEGVTSTGATGTGKFVFDGTPTLVTPVLGVATATSLTLAAGAAAETFTADANGGKMVIGSSTESLTLSTISTASITAGNLAPALSKVKYIIGRVTTTITTAVSYTIKITGGNAFKNVVGGSQTLTGMTANSTFVLFPNAFGDGDNGTATTLTVTTNANAGAGVIRLTTVYETLTAPTS